MRFTASGRILNEEVPEDQEPTELLKMVLESGLAYLHLEVGDDIYIIRDVEIS